MDITDSVRKVKNSSFTLASLPEETRNNALRAINEALEKNKAEIFAANMKDMNAAKEGSLPVSRSPMRGRRALPVSASCHPASFPTDIDILFSV